MKVVNPASASTFFQGKGGGNRVVEICSGLRVQVDPQLVRVVGVFGP